MHPIVTPPLAASRQGSRAGTPHGLGWIGVAVAAAIGVGPAAQAGDLPPQLMTRFTRQVQPLILNKCAAGACHGGPTAHTPAFNRGDVRGQIDRSVTLANIETLLAALGPSRSPASLLATISARHPASATGSSLVMTPLTTAERAGLEQWLTAAAGRPEAIAARQPSPPPSTARPNAATATPTQSPVNRFRAMLDTAANPPTLPPPQAPQGLILGKDGEDPPSRGRRSGRPD
ncbi:MAG: hypothetical protein RLZZ111_2236 [Planctomycetota bacterium]|jgi:hypothetical protein